MSKDKDDDERLWNLLLFNAYVTNKDLEEFGPAAVTIAGILVVIAMILLFW